MDELNALYDSLKNIWAVRSRKVHSATSPEVGMEFEISTRELVCLLQCVRGVLRECAGNPTELEIRVGSLDDVMRLANRLTTLTES